MKTMVDKFATDAIEECLMAQLASIFDPQTVLDMEDDVIEDIAGETEESKMERASSSQKLKVLQAALNALRRLDKHKAKGTSVALMPLALTDSVPGNEQHEKMKGRGSGKEAADSEGN
jgi:hypothetical protein